MIESRGEEERIKTEAQSNLIAYWASLRLGEDLPHRGAFDPGAVLRYLCDITVLEFMEDGQLNCRLESAAMKSRLSASDILASRRLGLRLLLEKQCPVAGVASTPYGAHHWLRLPLLSTCRDRLVILCHDEFVAERSDLKSNPAYFDGLSSHLVELAA
ncbi:MAG: PAS domain-containing protein [Pseudomonadota bacterium]